MAIFTVISLLIPLGIGIAAIFAAILAHRGQQSSATWTLLISSSVYLLSLIALGVFAFFSISTMRPGSSGPPPQENLIEILAYILYFFLVGSLLTYSYGIFLMGKQWKSHSDETAKLEKIAQELAIEREK